MTKDCFILIRFKVRLWSVVLTLCFIAVFCRLGVWQWERGLEKAKRLEALNKNAKPAPLSAISHFEAGSLVSVNGRFDNKHSFLLDNQFYKHKIGFDVITPLALQNGKWLLVDRGWVAAYQDRHHLPDIRSLEGIKSFNGRIYYPDVKSRILSERLDNEGQWPLIIERVDIASLSKRLGIRLYPFLLRMDRSAAIGYVREWQTVNMTPLRHYGYAGQWFIFAFIVLIMFIYFNVERKRGSQ